MTLSEWVEFTMPFKAVRKSAISAVLAAALAFGVASVNVSSAAADSPGKTATVAGKKKGNDYGSPGQGPSVSGPAPSLRAASITRSEVLERAKSWVGKGLDYNQGATYQGYRTDCSGYVSMAWNVAKPGYATNTFIGSNVAHWITKAELRPGDALNNPNPGNNGHITLFEKWTGSAQNEYWGYEFSGSGVHYRKIPYPYFAGNNPEQYRPMRLNSIADNAQRTGDLTGDGMADLAVYDKDGTIKMGRGFGDGFSGYHTITTGFGGYDGRLQFADVTGDGMADLLVYEKDGTIKMGRGFGDGFTDYKQISGGWGGYDGRLQFGDVTGDGKADLVAYEKDGTLTLGRGFGDGFTDYHTITTGFGGYDGRLHIVG